jgi:hypothetical protein
VAIHENGVKLPSLGIGEEPVQCRTRFLRGGYAGVGELLGDLPLPTLSVRAKLLDLHHGILFVGRNATVERDSHKFSLAIIGQRVTLRRGSDPRFGVTKLWGTRSRWTA